MRYATMRYKTIKIIIISLCILLFVVIAIFICYNMFYPVKAAVSQSDLDYIQRPYYLVKWVQVTGSSWMIIGDQDGYYKEGIYIIAEGEVPFKNYFNYDIMTGDNTYICYGDYIGESDIPGGEILKKYQFTD